ncbi:hypothetical protein [Pseudoalteromonas sp. S16_S37]|uniref:hypothetical protein n=1 Tax=Pseudoalteromonas sp. S16_S37 TaxID=2720228 RepID=UPI001681199C|nr:hypothetical protein [Pseudoalteromonas sp. S16_S37]MBD1582810.1 hypothetical protein [Pseudoalteromonas sp. S16_S37]
MSAKLTAILTVAGVAVDTIVSQQVQLDLNSTGRAKFEVVTEHEPTGIVELHLGYDINKMSPYFMGVIESKYYANGRWFLTCRELLGALSLKAPIAVRHATISKVLSALNNQIEFVIPDTTYSQSVVPAFYHSGTGIEALRQIGNVWQIPEFIFQQRPDGKIYVGAWHDSRFAQNFINNYPAHTIKSNSSTTGTLIAVPKLRPGIKLNGYYITEVTLINDRMQIRWSKQLLSA